MNALLVTLFLSVAHAGSLYVNGVRADTLRNFEFSHVDVKVDDQGNIWVDAPLYKVEMQSPDQAKAPEVRTVETPGTVPTPSASDAPVGVYWLVTEDNASVGHTIDVVVNGTLAQKVRSGDTQVILDIGKYLKVGTNTVVMTAQPSEKLDGGVVEIYIGTGANINGTLTMDRPLIDFARRATDNAGGASQSFEIVVK